jgi:peptidoglycan/LPS O-acetylase OafA/YrhL
MPHLENRKTAPNWALLAGVRFALAGVVVLAHLREANGPMPFLVGSRPGFCAVAAFLVLSGFSIRHSLEEPQGFFRRRAERLIPAYIVAFVFAGLPWLLLGPAINTGAGVVEAPQGIRGAVAFLGAALMLNGLFGPIYGTIIPGWSLAFEVVYYALGPILRRFGQVVPVISAGSALYFLWLSRSGYYDWVRSGWIGAAGLACFWLLGWMIYEQRDDPRRVATLSLAASGLSLASGNGSIWSVAVAALIPGAFLWQDQVKLPARSQSLLNWLGDASYVVYVCHFGLFLCGRAWGLHWGLTVAGTLIVCTAVTFAERAYRHRSKRR